MMLWVHSTFLSLDGEVNRYGQGYPSFFVRLSGCNLSCEYCDIPEARDVTIGEAMAVDELWKEVKRLGNPKVTITGGEPLLQAKPLNKLLWLFVKSGTRATIETNGTISLKELSKGEKHPNGHAVFPFGYYFNFVVDYKLNAEDAMNMEAFSRPFLGPDDWIKFVIKNRQDYNRAREVMSILHDKSDARFAMSPVHGQLDPGKLASWMLEDRLWNVNLNVQVHKLIGLP